MKPQQAQFDEQGKVLWCEVAHKPTDTRHLQRAMFTDRPDLWHKQKRKKGDAG